MVFVEIFGKHLSSTKEGSWVQHVYAVDEKARRRIRLGTLIFFLVVAALCLAFQMMVMPETFRETLAAPTNAPVLTPTIRPSPEATSPPEPTPARQGSSPTLFRPEILAKIAAENGVTVEEIVEANDIEDPSLINVGQVLVIPDP